MVDISARRKRRISRDRQSKGLDYVEMGVDVQDHESLHPELNNLHHTSLTLISRPKADGFSDDEARSL